MITQDFDPRVREALAKVPPGYWKEFSLFAGPRLDRLTGWQGKIVLVGDASHPLFSALGSGTAFAMEDGWLLARTIEYSHSTKGTLGTALEIFDKLRSPYYAGM